MDTLHSNRYTKVRTQTLDICDPLYIEDYIIQVREEVSPPKWHLAHSSWFFEVFILNKVIKNYKYYNKDFLYCFNSYYNSMGKMHTRSERGNLSRPTLEEVLAYRRYIDIQMQKVFEQEDLYIRCSNLIELGLEHEMQHQELLLMDIKCNFFYNPLYPKYCTQKRDSSKQKKSEFLNFEGGTVSIGCNREDVKFCLDNETPKHVYYIESFALCSHPITNRAYMEFIEDDGYQEPLLWLSDGWDWVRRYKKEHPEYWKKIDDSWFEFTLYGLIPIDLNDTLSHVTFFEACAFARWKGLRLPTEQEWEYAYTETKGNSRDAFLESKLYHPIVRDEEKDVTKFYMGQVWEYTSSPYITYPRYQQSEGALGEYNAKFTNNQRVLKGATIFTPSDHYRITYRNFFMPSQFWQCAGIRLAKDL